MSVLDFRHLDKGAGITVDDMKAALTRINYTLKPLDIVLIHTGAGRDSGDAGLPDRPRGMTGEATHWMLDQGVKVAGIDAVTFDPAGLGDVRAETVLGSAPGHAASASTTTSRT